MKFRLLACEMFKLIFTTEARRAQRKHGEKLSSSVLPPCTPCFRGKDRRFSHSTSKHNKHLITLLLVCLTFSTCSTSGNATAATPHKFYVSLAQADYNDKTKTLEVAIRMFADDLELALTKRERRAVHLDTTPDVAKIIRAYLQDRFEVRGRDGKVRELNWVGMESSVDSTWVYIEIPLGEDVDGASIRNRILLDLYQEQVNTTIVKAAGKQHTFAFRNGDEAWREMKETMK